MTTEQIAERIASKYWNKPSRILSIVFWGCMVFLAGYGLIVFISSIIDIFQTMDKTGFGDNFQSHYGQSLRHGLVTRMKSKIINLGLVCIVFAILNACLLHIDKKACVKWDKHVGNIKSSLKITGLGSVLDGEGGELTIKSEEPAGFRIEYMVPSTLYSKVVDESDVLNNLKIYFLGDNLSVEQFDDIYTLRDESNNIEKYYHNVSTVENTKKGGLNQFNA